MEAAFITIKIEKRIDAKSDEGLFQSLHMELMDQLNGVPQQQSYVWDNIKKTNLELVNDIEKALVESCRDDFKRMRPTIPALFRDQGIIFSPYKVKVVNHEDARNAGTGAFIFCYESDPITIIMRLADDKFLCAVGDKLDEIKKGRAFETFAINLTEEIKINRYRSGN